MSCRLFFLALRSITVASHSDAHETRGSLLFRSVAVHRLHRAMPGGAKRSRDGFVVITDAPAPAAVGVQTHHKKPKGRKVGKVPSHAFATVAVDAPPRKLKVKKTTERAGRAVPTEPNKKLWPSVLHSTKPIKKPPTARVYVATYFFSSLTIDKQSFGGVPYGWLVSNLCETLGVPICHSNVQVQKIADPLDVVEWGFEGGPRKGTGVYQCVPHANPSLGLCRQQKCFIGETTKSHSELVTVMNELQLEWTAASYHLVTRNCNHFVDELVKLLVAGTKAPGFINRGARLLRNVPIPGFGLVPKMVTKYLPSNGSWTGGRVCATAVAERHAVGVADFAERKDWDAVTSRRKTDAARGKKYQKEPFFNRDALANHFAPVPCLGERR